MLLHPKASFWIITNLFLLNYSNQCQGWELDHSKSKKEPNQQLEEGIWLYLFT